MLMMLVPKVNACVLTYDEYSEYNIAIDFARKKKICAFRKDEESRSANRQKDLETLVRAGFSYDIAKDVLDAESQ